MDFDVALAVQAFVTLLVIMDPLGNVPVFLALTAGDDLRRRRRTALHATLAALVLIYLFAFFGTRILETLSIGMPALQVAGGIMLFLTALEMFKGDILLPEASEGVNVAIVPLGVPFVAGPGAIAASMVLMGEGGTGISLATHLPVVVGIALALLVVYLALRYSLFLERLLRDNGIHLITRVMGMLLLAISVQLVASGVLAFTRGGG